MTKPLSPAVDVQFLWFGDCPHHDAARRLLREVIAEVAPVNGVYAERWMRKVGVGAENGASALREWQRSGCPCGQRPLPRS